MNEDYIEEYDVCSVCGEYVIGRVCFHCGKQHELGNVQVFIKGEKPQVLEMLFPADSETI
jgi:hypothetical protein